MNAAVMMVTPRMSPAASGWRAMDSVAADAMRPIPIPAPIAAMPAPRPAPIRPNPQNCDDGVDAWARASASRWCMASPYSFLVFLGHGQTGEDGSEDGEDIGLDQRDQHLEERDEEDEGEGGDGRGHADHRARIVLDPQEEAEEDQQDRVAPRHVGEQTNGQGEGFREEPDDLDHEQERP